MKIKVALTGILFLSMAVFSAAGDSVAKKLIGVWEVTKEQGKPAGEKPALGMPGVRDRHSGCVSAYMVEHDLFDFLLLSLPDNDWYSHKKGPDAQVESIAQADLQLARVAEAAGGLPSYRDLNKA